LARFRDEFLMPRHGAGEVAYFTGNSLGLMSRPARAAVEEVLERWGLDGVEGHFRGAHPWMPYHRELRAGLATVAGAKPHEVVAMNSLTANLHLMMVSFYRPTAQRHRILIEKRAFPSDRHAVVSQLRYHGHDPATALIELDAGTGREAISLERIAECLREQGERIALVLWPGVQYASGQRFDLAAITRLAQAQGCQVGFDLAHAIGNVPVDLHQAGPDFAVWCSYKYLNGGPGAVAGCFVHERHADADLPRFAGWWGHEERTRFQMGPEFHPARGADGWQLSNPPILAMAPLRASLDLFCAAGIAALRAKSVSMTGWLAAAIERELGDAIDILTPSDPEQRGCQLSLRVRAGRQRGRQVFEHLAAQGIICDWREPDVIRAAPVPLYNRYADCEKLVAGLREGLSHA
jgi:kynureninase